MYRLIASMEAFEASPRAFVSSERFKSARYVWVFEISQKKKKSEILKYCSKAGYLDEQTNRQTNRNQHVKMWFSTSQKKTVVFIEYILSWIRLWKYWWGSTKQHLTSFIYPSFLLPWIQMRLWHDISDEWGWMHQGAPVSIHYRTVQYGTDWDATS